MYFLDLSVLIYLFYLSLFFLNVYRFSNQINISLCGLARVSVVESDCSAGDTEDAGSAPGWWWSPGGGNGNPLQFSCLKNLMNRGAWQATVHGVTGSRTQLSTHTHPSIMFTNIKNVNLCAIKFELRPWQTLFLYVNNN